MEALAPRALWLSSWSPLHDTVSSRQHMVMELAENGVGIEEGQQRQGKNNHGEFHWMMWNATHQCKWWLPPSLPT